MTYKVALGNGHFCYTPNCRLHSAEWSGNAKQKITELTQQANALARDIFWTIDSSGEDLQPHEVDGYDKYAALHKEALQLQNEFDQSDAGIKELQEQVDNNQEQDDLYGGGIDTSLVRRLRDAKLRHALKEIEEDKEAKLIQSNGVMVRKGAIAVNNFQLENPRTANGVEGHSWEEIAKLVKENWKDRVPGTGSENMDTVLVPIPATGFTTSIIDITPENADKIETIDYTRRSGEEPVPHKIIRTDSYPPANAVKVVVYRADVLAKDNDRSTDAEWEIVAVLRQAADDVPMDLETMKRNSEHGTGGTQRTYTQEQWDTAESFWKTHAYAWTQEDEDNQIAKLAK